MERRQGETDPDVLIRDLVKGAKRTSNEANTRRPTFIMSNQAAAASWHAKSILFRGKCFQLLCPDTMKREDITTPSIPETSAGRNFMYYQVRVLVNGVAASTVQAIFASSVSCAVKSVYLRCYHGSDAYDSIFSCRHLTRWPVPNSFSWFRIFRISGRALSPSFSALSTRSLLYLLSA